MMMPSCLRLIPALSHTIKNITTTKGSRGLLKIGLMAVSLLGTIITTPAAADLYLYENPWGQLFYSDAPIKDPDLKLLQYKPSTDPYAQAQKSAANSKSLKVKVSKKSSKRKKRFDKFDHHIEAAAKKFAIDPALIKAVIHAESAFNPKATSRVGAQGLMQLMPATAAGYDVKDPYNPQENIIAGTKHLKYLMKRFPKNVDFVLAAYNAGEVPVRKYKGIPPYKETQRYVKKVKRFLASYDGTL